MQFENTAHRGVLILSTNETDILTVKLQKGQPCIWVLLDIEKPKYKRNFCWIRMGEPIEHRDLVYIETLLSNDGDRVSHYSRVKACQL